MNRQGIVDSGCPRAVASAVAASFAATTTGRGCDLAVTVELSDDTVYENCLQVLEWNPLEPEGIEYKYYAPGVGLIMEEEGEDELLELVDME